MKIIAFFSVLLLLSSTTFAQKNLYSYNNGQLFQESEVRQGIDKIKSSLPPNIVMTPVIYHKIIKKDTIINFISIRTEKKSADVSASATAFKYLQDSTFLLINKQLPAFELIDLDGNKVSSASLKGKPTLINFWATYCGPCIAEMPELSRLKDKYKDVVNFISIAEEDDKDYDLKTFLKNKNFNYPVLDKGEDYKKDLKIASLPKNFFIDKKGMLRFIQNNYPLNNEGKPVSLDAPENYFVKIIEELIKEAI